MPQERSWHVPSSFELHTLIFDQRKLIYFRRLEGDLGMCRLNVRAVFLPKLARPTGLREVLVISFSLGERGGLFSCICILIIKTAVHRQQRVVRLLMKTFAD